MAWRTINGRRYYYRSRRVGDRVESSYVNRGELACVLALMDEEDRAGREEERDERRQADAEDREVADWFARVEGVAATPHRSRRSRPSGRR